MGLFSWLFKKKDLAFEPDSEPQESWIADAKNNDWRWVPEEHQDYKFRVEPTGPELSVLRERVFAWAVNPFFRYRNFSLKAKLGMGATGYGSGGFLFRYMDDSTFYSFLVSNRGQFRVDVVFNGSPIPLIPWTPVPGTFDPSSWEVAAVARDETFTFAVNGQWVGETTDDMIDRGRLALAAQSYEGSPLSVRLVRVELESREIPIEKELEFWEEACPPAASQRLALAESLASGMRFREAAFQLSKLRASGALTKEGVLLLSQCWLEDGLYNEALGAVEELLKTERWDMALKQKAAILYLMSRYLDLRDFVQPLVEEFPLEGPYWMSLGHAEHQLGNWLASAQAYSVWADLEPDLPLAWLYAGNLWEKVGEIGKAMERFPRAAELSFRQGAATDLEGVLEKIRRLAPQSGAMAALEGKIAYSEGLNNQALSLFARSRELGTIDPAVEYLEGMILRDEGQRVEALKKFRLAAEIEPGYGLFRFRYAEFLHLNGDPGALDEALRACETDPGSAWSWNLLGLCLTDPVGRAEAFEKASKLDPTLEDPLLNFCGELRILGRIPEAERLLLASGTARAWNLLGNIRADQGRWEEAENLYRRALRQDPSLEDALANLRRPLWEEGKMGELEKVLSQLLAIKPEEPEYLLDMAQAAWSLGDWPRGEVSLRILLGIDPANADARRSLFRHYLGRFKHEKAAEVLVEAEASCPSTDWSEEKKALRNATQDMLSCASCGREWWLPKSFPDPGKLRLVGEPPPDAPGGRSPVTGKIYCVRCAQEHLCEGRFLCSETGEPLVLDKALVYLMMRYLESQEPGTGGPPP